MVVFDKKKCFTLFIASEPQLKNSRTLKTTGAVGWDLWSKSIQVWESRLSFGCMRKGPWQFSYPLLFSCTPPSLYNIINTSNSLVKPLKSHTSLQKTHSNKVVGSIVCFITTFTNILSMVTLTVPPKKNSQFFYKKKIKISLPPPNDQHPLINQSNPNQKSKQDQPGSNRLLSVSTTTTTAITTNNINYTSSSESTKIVPSSRKEPKSQYSLNKGTLVVIVFIFKEFVVYLTIVLVIVFFSFFSFSLSPINNSK